MHHTRISARPTTFAVPVAALALAVLIAACGTAGAVGQSPTPSSPATPSVTPLPISSPAPSTPAPDRVPLVIATDHEVAVVIKDRTGWLVSAKSGTPGDGMSVRWFDVAVRNVDPSTLEVTWSGLPADSEIELLIREGKDGVFLRFTQPAPPVDSDALGFDRVLVLVFDHPVDAGAVTAKFETAAG